MLPPLARKPMILPFWTSDKSLRFCITPTIGMFSEALTHPLYTLNCTVLSPAFCDWLFNSEVETYGILEVHRKDRTFDRGIYTYGEKKKSYSVRTYGWSLVKRHVVVRSLFNPLFGLEIHQNDHQARRRFVEWAQNEIAVVSDFHKRILFSDEAHFWLNGYVNKQNCRIQSEANPQVYVETPLHTETLTVWCALWAGGIIGLYFFKNDEVNRGRYRAMITNFFIPEWNNHDVQEL
ncbi:DUF4817 domain-containing protein [Trichonephila clavipes]|nr:DUF4817 domain-containing protein [Trichonephila clavipes]